MAKLQPDYIKWVLTLNATEAQEELHKLEKANRELGKQTEASRKKMAQLEAEGKKGSVEWKNLRNSISQNNREMALNRAKMEELKKRLDLGSMSINQLKKRLQELQREFNNTSRATNPERYEELRRAISGVRGALDEARSSTRSLRTEFFSLEKMKQVLVGFFNGIGLAIAGYVIDSFKKMVDTIQDFERANSKLAAVLGTSIDGVSRLTEQAKLLGRTTTATASEVTGLQTELAKLGFSQEVIEQLTPATLKFAHAVDTDLSSAATRNILLNLADSNGALAQALGGPVKNLDDLVAGMKKLNAEGVDLAKVLELTDKRSVAAFSRFLAGADDIIALRDSITGCTADFNSMSDTMGDNAAGTWAGFESAVTAPGYADGGFVSSVQVAGVSELAGAVRDLKEAARNIRAYVVYRDIERAGAAMDRARAPFTR